jgi:hypothetical protein
LVKGNTIDCFLHHSFSPTLRLALQSRALPSRFGGGAHDRSERVRNRAPSTNVGARYLALALLALAAPSALAGDGFPIGFSTPEGAACEFARAFINRDSKLFDEAVLMPFGRGESRANYEAFLAGTRASIVEEARRPADRGPEAIAKVYAARSLSRSGPASYAYATFNFADLKFVDVVVTLHGGGVTTNRTLVVKDSVGLWHVHPAPHIHTMLSTGLNDEPPSTKEVPLDSSSK